MADPTTARGRVGVATMEALALISALAIAAIFVYAQYARQAQDFDLQAQRLAGDLRPAVEALFSGQPQASLSPEALKAAGAAIPAPLEVTVPPYKDRAGDWQVQVQHPQGQKRFTLSASGVQSEYR
jgi:hypothetical protein